MIFTSGASTKRSTVGATWSAALLRFFPRYTGGVDQDGAMRMGGYATDTMYEL